MKNTTPTAKFGVSFNCEVEGEEFGESDMSTLDFYGDDITALAKEVVEDSSDFPLKFIKNPNYPNDSKIIGWFSSVEDDYEVGVMVEHDVLW